MAVITFPKKQIGPWMPQCVVTGLHNWNGEVTLCVPDRDAPLGTKLLRGCYRMDGADPWAELRNANSAPHPPSAPFDGLRAGSSPRMNRGEKERHNPLTRSCRWR